MFCLSVCLALSGNDFEQEVKYDGIQDNLPSKCWQTGEKNDGTNVKDAEGRWH